MEIYKRLAYKNKINYLEILEKALENNISRELYSIGVYREESFCIEEKNSEWIVYVGERGKKHDIKSFKDAREACYELIARVSESDEEERKVKYLFDLCLIRNQGFSRTKKKVLGGVPYFNKSDAIAMVKYATMPQVDDIIKVHISTGCNGLIASQQVRGAVTLPNSISKDVKILVFAKGDKIIEAKEAGADFVGGEEFVSKIKDDGWLGFDVVVATPDMMGVVGRLGRILGPKGLMPNPKAGTVTMDVSKAIKDTKAGKIEYRLDKSNIVHVPVGKVSFTEEALQQNFDVLMDAIVKARPKTMKAQYIKGITLSSAEGVAVKVNLQTIDSK